MSLESWVEKNTPQTKTTADMLLRYLNYKIQKREGSFENCGKMLILNLPADKGSQTKKNLKNINRCCTQERKNFLFLSTTRKQYVTIPHLCEHQINKKNSPISIMST